MNEPWIADVYKNYRSWKQWEERRVLPTEPLLHQIELDRSGIEPPAALLEIGYGDGTFLRHALARGHAVAGVELADDGVEALRGLGIDARAGSVADFDDRSFALVVAFDVFEHMPAAEILETLRQVRRVLVPGGRLLARFPNAASPFGAINQFGDITHRTALSGQSFTQLAAVAGFKTVLVANAAWTWRGNSLAGSILKPLALAARRCIELVLGFVYFGRLVPLDPEVTVIVESADAGLTLNPSTRQSDSPR
jgi:SAM-dependent methyltransferase